MNRSRITTREFKRRVFNTALLECFAKVHGMALNGACDGDPDCDSNHMTKMAHDMATEFYKSELELPNRTIDETKAALCEATTFVKDMIAVSESIACTKCEDATEEKLELYDDQKIELSEEDQDLIDKLFDEKNPDVQTDQIRDATVKALLAEDRKAQEIKDSITIANSTVASGTDPKALEETAARLEQRGPTSLMGAIMNSVSIAAVKDVSNNGNMTSVGSVMKENADTIKTRAAMIYALYESASVLGVHKYTAAEIENLAKSIYYAR